MAELSETNIEEIITNINELQAMESNLYDKLQASELPIEEKQQIIDEIFKIANLRINLFDSVNQIDRLYLDELNNNQKVLLDQFDAIQIIEDKLRDQRENLDNLNQVDNNNKRMIEINSYYSARYEEHTSLLKIILYMMIPIIFAIILLNYNLINNYIFYGILVIVALVGGYYLIKRYLSMINRNNMEYDAYNWAFDKKDAPKPGKVIDNPWNIGVGKTCIGSNCCSEGMNWDSDLGKCVSVCDSSTTPTTESFSGYKTIYQKENINNNRKPDVILDSQSIKPYECEGFKIFK